MAHNLLALFVFAGLYGLARLLSSKQRPLDSVAWIYVLLFSMSAFLATRAWVTSPTVEWGCLTVLMFGSVRTARDIASILKNSQARQSKWLRALGTLIIAALVLDFLYAGLPLYRYDQWTYHLVVAKWISQMGSLTLPVTYDHIFFTGSYEFLGLLARAVSSSDTFQQGFQNSLSWLLVAVPAALIFKAFRSNGSSTWLASMAFSAAIVFGSGDHEALINAKPDYVLMMVALLLILFMMVGPGLISSSMAGFLLVAGLSFKITWLHFALCAPFVFWFGLIGAPKKNMGTFFGGGIAGLLCILPWAFKNWQFFKNPLHPIQSMIFQSSLWNPQLDAYWQRITMKPRSPGEFTVNFFESIANLPVRWALLVTVLLGVIAIRWRQQKSSGLKGFPWLGFGLSLLAYLVGWGIFYNAEIFNRFVAASFAFPIALILWQARTASPNSLYVLILMIPFLLQGQLEVTISRLAKAATTPWPEFAQGEKGPLQLIHDLTAISEDRKQRFPDAKYTEAALLSDNPFNYYGPSVFWIAHDQFTWINMEQAGIDPVTGDGFKFLEKMNIRYVWIVNTDEFKGAPPALQSLISKLEPIPSRIGQLYRVTRIPN